MKKILFIAIIILYTFIFTSCEKAPTSTEAEIVPPSNLTAIVINNIVQLEWQDNSNNEEGFVIERKLNGEDYEDIATVEQNVTTYIDENIEFNNTYLFRIYGFDQNNNSSYSNEVEIMVMDTIPPNKPQLVPHLGDTGDIIQDFQGNTDTLNFYNTNDLDFENNGIDAVIDGNWIKTQWSILEDSDIDYLKIFRFSWQDYLNDTLDFVQIIDSVDFDNEIKYVDKTPMIDKDYFYFIEAFDEAGNSTISDTTGYKLMYKPILTSPSDYATLNINQVTFEWQADSNVNQYRLLVFNEERELIWRKEPLDTGYFSVQYDGPPVESGATLIWRVDAFDYDSEIYIEDNYYIVNTGAESVERYLLIE